MTFDKHGQTALTLGKPEARTMSLPQGEEWYLYSLSKGSQERPQLPFKVPGVWANGNPPGLAQPRFSLLAKPLYEATKVGEQELLLWESIGL